MLDENTTPSPTPSPIPVTPTPPHTAESIPLPNSTNPFINPHLRFAEVTVVKHQPRSLLSYCLPVVLEWDVDEGLVDKEQDLVLIAFDEDAKLQVLDTKDHYVDFQYTFPSFGKDTYITMTDRPVPHTLFKKQPTDDNGKPRLNFSAIPANNPRYSRNDFVPSIYNVILYTYAHYNTTDSVRYPNDVFYIVRLHSSNRAPRYVVAFDGRTFTKPKVIYLVRNIFLQLYI